MIRDKFGVAELKPTGTQPWQSASVVSIFLPQSAARRPLLLEPGCIFVLETNPMPLLSVVS